MKKLLRLLAFLALLLLTTLPALAQSGKLIYQDDAGKLDRTQVARAAQPLISRSANVAIYTANSGGETDFRRRLQQDGLASGGGIEPNTIAIYVSLNDRYSGMLFGDRWNAALATNDNYETIRTNDLNAGLSPSSFTSGVVNALGAIDRSIASPPQTGGGTTVNVNFVPIVLGVIFLVLLFVVVPLVVRAIGKRRAAAQAFARARQAADDARKRAGAAIADMGQVLKDAQEKAQYDQLSYAPADVQQIGEWQRAAESQFVDAQERFDAAGEALAARRTPTQAEYEASAQAYDQIAQIVEAARAQLAQAEARRAELDRLNAAAPGEADRAKKALADAAARLESLGPDFAHPQAILQPVADMVARAEALLAEHRAADAIAAAGAASANIDELNRALERYADIHEGISAGRAAAEKIMAQGYRIEAGLAAFNTAEGVLRQAAATIERDLAAARTLLDQADAARELGVARGGGMPALRQENDARLAQTKQAGEQIDAQIAQGREAFALVDDFAEKTWSDIRGNGSESEAAAARARQLWERATQRNSMETQDFLGAKQDLDAADEQIGYARALVDSILQRLKDLQAARDAAHEEIAAAQADVEQGWKYVRANDPDIGKNPEHDLTQAAALLEQANAELQQARPDYLTIVKQAQEANRLADQAIANARGEVDAMNKLREQAQRAQQLATAEVQKIVQFVSLHKNDLPPASERRVDNLQAQIQQAYATLKAADRDEEQTRAEDLRAAVTRYTALEHDAESLYEEIYAAFQRIDILRKQVAAKADQAQRTIDQTEQRLQNYAQMIRPSADVVRLLQEARAALDSIGAPREEQALQRALQTAEAAYNAAERADQILISQLRQVQRSQPGGDFGDFLGGVVVGSLLNSGHHRHGGGGGGGWSGSGGGGGAWGGGGGGGGWGGGGGGGGWGGGGGGGSGW